MGIQKELSQYLKSEDKYSADTYIGYWSIESDNGKLLVDGEENVAYIWSGLGDEDSYAYKIDIKSVTHLKLLEQALCIGEEFDN